MKFPDLVKALGTSNGKNVRFIIQKLGLPILETARTIPDEYIDVITEQYNIDFAPLFRRSVTSDADANTPPAPKVDFFSISSNVIDASIQEEQIKRVAEKKKSAEKKVKEKEDAEKAKKAAENPVIETKKEKVTTTPDISLDLNLDLDLDLEFEEEEKTHDDDVEEMDDMTLEDEKIQRELERELRKSGKKVKSDEEIETELREEEQRKAKEKEEMFQPKQNAVLPEIISVKEFSEKIGIQPAKIVGELLKNGIFVTINHKIDFDTAALVADAFGVIVTKQDTVFSTTDLMQGNLTKLLGNEDTTKLEKRPAIVSIMGHVDHGKTSLLDYIRKAKVAASEAGGITQHIGAYQVELNDRKITFLDTPGHEAFTAMRARGAKATDIAILVVAADEGVKPQTEEAINHAKDAEIPIIVALNKMDKEGINLDKVKSELSEKGLIPEDWGGDTVMVPISAKAGTGIDTLLEMILLSTDLLELRANPNRPAIGTIIESRLDPSLGPIATVLVNTGTLQAGDNFVVGDTFGRVKTMHDALGKNQKIAVPSTPVRVSGFEEVPQAGDILQVVKDSTVARNSATEMKNIRQLERFAAGGASFSDLITRINQGELKQLKVVLKADTKGSLEAVRSALLKLNTDEVQVTIIHSGIGNVTDTDVLMASASGGVILAFHVETSAQIEKSAEKKRIVIKTYRVIYHLTDEIKRLLSGMLDPLIQEVPLGDFQVIKMFFTSKKYLIIGGKVTKGKIEAKAKVRVVRGDKLVGEGTIDTLQKGTENVSEVAEGHECGIRFNGNCDPEEKDIFEVYKVERIERSL